MNTCNRPVWDHFWKIYTSDRENEHRFWKILHLGSREWTPVWDHFWKIYTWDRENEHLRSRELNLGNRENEFSKSRELIFGLRGFLTGGENEHFGMETGEPLLHSGCSALQNITRLTRGSGRLKVCGRWKNTEFRGVRILTKHVGSWGHPCAVSLNLTRHNLTESWRRPFLFHDKHQLKQF